MLARIGCAGQNRTTSLVLKSLRVPLRGGLPLLAAATFAAGLAAGAAIAPGSASRGSETIVAATPPSFLRSGHPAEVLRVLDGDTFEAKVRIWPGMEITTRVRLREIDAPEMHARCADERVKALASRDEEQKRLPHRITTEVAPAGAFWITEEYHHQWHEKHGTRSCPFPHRPREMARAEK